VLSTSYSGDSETRSQGGNRRLTELPQPNGQLSAEWKPAESDETTSAACHRRQGWKRRTRSPRRANLPWFARAVVALAVAPVLAHAQPTEVVLHNFGCPPRGANPESGMIGDSVGNLYGTSHLGGKTLTGMVFSLKLTAANRAVFMGASNKHATFMELAQLIGRLVGIGGYHELPFPEAQQVVLPQQSVHPFGIDHPPTPGAGRP